MSHLKTPSIDFLRFGIPSLDHLFTPAAGLNKDWTQWGIQLPQKNGKVTGTTSISFIGRSGTGKSVLGLHLASRYLADACQVNPKNLPRIFYISTDLTEARGVAAWEGFGLHRPNQRTVPFGEEKAFQPTVSAAAKPRKPFELRACPFGGQELTDALSGQPENPTVWFVDLASSTAGDDWGLLIRLLALLPPREPDEPKHLVIIDAVEGLETMGGSVDVHGHERSRRSRIAQVLRTAGDKCHVAFVLEETVAGSTPDEEFVTDVVIRLWAKEEYRYMRRTLEVTKARGNSHVRGHHHYLIRDGRGIADNPDEPGNQDQAYFYLVDSLHWLTRMKMISSENLEPGSETTKNKRKQTPAPQRHKEYAKLHAPKLPRTLPYNGLPRGEVTALTGDEATYKSRFARAVLAGALRQLETKSTQDAQLEPTHEVAVYLTTQNLTRKDVLEKLHWHIPPKIGQSPSPFVDHEGNEKTGAEQIIFLQLEAHNLDSATLFHIIRRCVEKGIQRVAELKKDSEFSREWQWWQPGQKKYSNRVRVVIDDWTTIKNSYPQVAADSLFLPFLIRYLEEIGVTTLIVETSPGRPDELFTRDSQRELRGLVRNHLMTWHVRFFGDDRVAFAAIPPLSDVLGPAVAELSAPPADELTPEERHKDERLWADPHFELYTGLELGLPQPVPLAVHLFACAQKSSAYREQLNALFNRLFTPRSDQTDVVLGFAPGDYAALREYSHLVGGVQSQHTSVMQVDEYWHPPLHAPAPTEDAGAPLLLDSYIQQATTDLEQRPHRIHDPHLEFQPTEKENKRFKDDKQPRWFRHDFFQPEGYGKDWSKELGNWHLVPFLWDFGFLLLRDKLWKNALEALPSDPNNPKSPKQLVTRAHELFKLPTPQDIPVSWRDFFAACQIVAQNQPSNITVPAFDLDLLTPQTFAALVLEVWASEIYTKRKGKNLPFNHERHPALPIGKETLSTLLKNHENEFLRVWLLLGEIIPSDLVLNEDGTMQTRTAHSASVAERHWYSTAAHLGKKHGEDDPYVAVRLPGHYTTRGDWFLTLGAESRSRQLGERAMDLLGRRKDNVARLEHGIGLPVRDFEMIGGNPDKFTLYKYLRTPLLARHPDTGTIGCATYADIRNLGACPPNPAFSWLWRSQIEHYHRQDRIWERWLARFMRASAAWNRHLKFEGRSGFDAYDAKLTSGTKLPKYIRDEFRDMMAALKDILNKINAEKAHGLPLAKPALSISVPAKK